MIILHWLGLRSELHLDGLIYHQCLSRAKLAVPQPHHRYRRLNRPALPRNEVGHLSKEVCAKCSQRELSGFLVFQGRKAKKDPFEGIESSRRMPACESEMCKVRSESSSKYQCRSMQAQFENSLIQHVVPTRKSRSPRENCEAELMLVRSMPEVTKRIPIRVGRLPITASHSPGLF